jgi:UDP-2-acetamido-2-deoxy-ribo-hexuluronate aminotransferase
MHLLLASDVVTDLCRAGTDQTLLDRARANGDYIWLYAGSAGEFAKTADPGSFKTMASSCQWLSALSGEAKFVFESGDAELAQLLAALPRLGKDARIVTGVQERLAHHPAACISAAVYLQTPAKPKAVSFIDLEYQQSLIRGRLEARIDRVLRHGQYIMGPEIVEVEQQLSGFVGVKHAITVASGTDALLIALMALDIGPGDEVITVPYTWISTAEVIALLRAKTVFVDIQSDTMNMDPEKLEAAITPRTKAIMPVGIYGQCADMTRINAIAAKHGIPVIEDAAQCFGATHHGKKSCGLSLIGCTSFFPSKPLGCYGDGGAIFTPDDKLADKMKQIRVHGQKVKHQHPVVGINGRFDTLQAAILLEKLTIFDDECALRRQVGERYDRLLVGPEGFRPPVIAEGNTSVYAQYTLIADDPNALSDKLKRAGIPSVSYYAVPLHLQGAFADLGYRKGDFPVAENIASHGLSLPMSPYLTEQDQINVVKAMKS